MMLSPMRSLILAIPFALVATLFSAPSTRASALALPGPFPMPFRNADYNGHLASLPHTTSPDLGKKYAAAVSGHTSDKQANASLAHHEYPARTGSLTLRAFRRGVSDLDAMLEGLGSYRDDATTDSEELQYMASQSASQDENDSAFQQNAASRLSSFQSNAQGFSSILGQLAADKGLANYDKNNELETMLKDFVNANKDALSAVTTLSYNIPDLGPVLGPIVYEVKCIVDEVLDITENLTDAILNSLQPLLQPLVAIVAPDTSCKSGIKVLGVCVG